MPTRGGVALLAALLACTSTDARVAVRGEGVDTVRYQPAVVVLTGVLQVVQEYGAPNFGETPDRDALIDVPILRLSHGIVVLGDSTSEVNLDTFENVLEIQLVGVPEEMVVRLNGARVAARGTLFERESGYHYRDVLMTVSQIDPTEG
jgi:hypothetical protein